MKSRVIFAVCIPLAAALVACTSVSVTEYPVAQHLQLTFKIPEQLEGQPAQHTELRYLLYLPEGYGEDPNKTWPLILFLHGSGDADYDAEFVMEYGLPAVLQQNEMPDDFGFIVLMPQAFPGTLWWESDQLQTMNALLDDVLTQYQVDTRRIYLTGLSMGGYGSWYLATLYPDRFAAMMSVSGSGYQVPGMPVPEILCVLRDIPIWVIHGAQDTIAEPDYNEWVITNYQAECDDELKWTLYPDAGHRQAFERAYRDPALYAWFMQQQR